MSAEKLNDWEIAAVCGEMLRNGHHAEFVTRLRAHLSATPGDRPVGRQEDYERLRGQWLMAHVDYGHGITRRDRYDECSCGATFWRVDPVSASSQDEGWLQRQARRATEDVNELPSWLRSGAAGSVPAGPLPEKEQEDPAAAVHVGWCNGGPTLPHYLNIEWFDCYTICHHCKRSLRYSSVDYIETHFNVKRPAEGWPAQRLKKPVSASSPSEAGSVPPSTRSSETRGSE